MHFIMNNTEWIFLCILGWQAGNREEGIVTSSVVQGQLAFLGWEAVKGLPFQQYGLQPPPPLLIKFNKATLNWGDQMIFSSIDEWAFNLGLGG